MKNIIFFPFILFFTNLFADGGYEDKNPPLRNSHFLTSKVGIVVKNKNKTLVLLDSLYKKCHVKPNEQSTTEHEIDLHFKLDSTQYFCFTNEMKSLGYIKYFNTTNGKIDDPYFIEDDIKLLKRQKEQYEKLSISTDTVERHKYFQYHEKIIELDKEITELESKIRTIKKINKIYVLNIKIEEEKIVGEDYYDSWVNMPGVEFSILTTENPISGISPTTMNGYCLKYLFNYQKTYFTMGLYQSQNTFSASEINEMYVFAFGQDFYSRRLGRGKRKFLNLYTSVNAGFYISSSENQKTSSCFTNPFLGLEIYKNKNILIDNKIGYFLPFKNNREQRGSLYNVSVNFVF